MQTEIVTSDIAIVGGGIAGPALAAALANTNLRIVLIEKSPGVLDTARGDHLQPVACEWLDEWGVLQLMWDSGAERRMGSVWKTPDGETVLRAPVDELPIPHRYFAYLNHELISQSLLNRASDNRAFTLLKPAMAKLLPNGQAPGRHAIQLTHDNGQRQKINSACIVAADGRNSGIRKALAIETNIHKYTHPLLVLFAPRTREDPRNEVHVYLSQAGVISVVPRTGGFWKIGFPLDRSELSKWQKASSREIGHQLSTLVPDLKGIKPTVAGVYPVAMVNARNWVAGNTVLLGDACHALHPGRSQGMNAALRAVHVLAGMIKARPLTDDKTEIEHLLLDYQARCQPAMNSRLAENHARGLEMDRMEPANIRRMQSGLTRIAGSPKKLQAYCMNASGY
jgi:2-polyprenyl-6-methoxyphenol hydroxylase-like FAD-dependent oxidoreductase